jgi:hypothetical protein
VHTSDVHATATLLYVPTLHATHTPPDRYAPEVHAVQYTELLAPNTLVNWPTAHEVHDERPGASEYEPATHAVQEAAPEATLLYAPARHDVHTTEDVAPPSEL